MCIVAIDIGVVVAIVRGVVAVPAGIEVCIIAIRPASNVVFETFGVGNSSDFDALGAEGEGVAPVGGVAVAADGANVDVILSVGVKATDDGGVDSGGDESTRIEDEVSRTIDDVEVGVASGVPGDDGAVGGRVDEVDVFDAVAGANHIDRQVVDIAVDDAALRCDDGDARSVAVVVAEAYLDGLPSGDCRITDNAYSLEGVEILGIGHYTDIELVGIAAIGRIHPEADLEGVDGSIELGQDKIGVAARTAIHIERLGAAVNIRGRGHRIVAIGIGRCGIPARGIARSGIVLETGDEGQRLGTAFGESADGGIHSGVAANGSDAEVVAHIGREVRIGPGVAAGGAVDGPDVGGVGTMLDNPRGFLIASGPADANIVGGNRVDSNNRSGAGGQLSASGEAEDGVHTVRAAGAAIESDRI